MDLPVFLIGSADRDFRLYRQVLILDRAVDDHDRVAFENECFSHLGCLAFDLEKDVHW
jgi:hypothetical protein